MSKEINRVNSLRPDIHKILQAVGLGCYHASILRIASALELDRLSALRDLTLIDKTIPGLGQHNVSQMVEGAWYTGVYRNEDRPIFRSFQYVDAYIQRENLEWASRDIVTVSCLHVENSLKRILSIDAPLSIGMILGDKRGKLLESDMRSILWDLNSLVYNNAKHTIEDIDMDSHMFSIADSLAIYLICRMIGARLLKDSGISTRHGVSVFQASGADSKVGNGTTLSLEVIEESSELPPNRHESVEQEERNQPKQGMGKVIGSYEDLPENQGETLEITPDEIRELAAADPENRELQMMLRAMERLERDLEKLRDRGVEGW